MIHSESANKFLLMQIIVYLKDMDIWRLKRNIDFNALKAINWSIINEKLAEECKRNGGDQAIDEFWEGLYSTQMCFGSRRIFVIPKDTYLSKIDNCTQDLISKAEQCLSDEHKFYPKFVVTALTSFTEFAYDHLNLNKLTPSSDIVFCLQRIKSAGGVPKMISQCTQDLIPSQTNELNVSLPNKAAVCKLLKETRDCFNTFITGTCARDIAVDKVLGNFTNAVQKPCEDS